VWIESLTPEQRAKLAEVRPDAFAAEGA